MIISIFCRQLITVLSLTCVLFTAIEARPALRKRRARKTTAKKVGPQQKCSPVTAHTQQPVSVQQIVVPLAEIENASVPIQKEYTVSQGRTLHLKIAAPQPLKQAYTTFAGTQYNFAAVPNRNNRYECFLPIDCDQQPGQYKLIVRTQDEKLEQKSIGCGITVDAFPFKPQRGFKISKKKLQSIRRSGVGNSSYGHVIREYQKNSPTHKLWDGPFAMPINVERVTSPFGEVRTSHGFGKRKHYGIDLAQHHKAPIHAANHGILVHKTHSKTAGNMIVLDHGLGVFTIYCHMNSFDSRVKTGDRVIKGQRIGFIGQTGYASGPHLHLELRIKDAKNLKTTAVDFMEWNKQIY